MVGWFEILAFNRTLTATDHDLVWIRTPKSDSFLFCCHYDKLVYI
jgi:hypothetical protein